MATETCQQPIGLENKILDSAFSASSIANKNTQPHYARIRSETNGWCPSRPITPDTYEYLEINLINLTVITLLEIQGGNQLKKEQFADYFRLEYKRHEDGEWIRYKSFTGQEKLNGNINNYIPAMREILPLIVARRIRIIPVTDISKKVCIRLELYGCPSKDGLLSYSMPQGDKRGFNMLFIDNTYDGKNLNGTLIDGLGQLTDGVLGTDNYLADGGIGKVGYDWIGWKKGPERLSSVDLIFNFDNQRNFSLIKIYTNNMFSKDISLFDSVTIATSLDGLKFESELMYYPIHQDYLSMKSRFVEIPLKFLIGKTLKITLLFNKKWILISEVKFESSVILSNTIRKPNTIRHLFPIVAEDKLLNKLQQLKYLLVSIVALIVSIVILIVFTLRCTQNCKNKQVNKMSTYLGYTPISIKFPHNKIGCCYNNNTRTLSSDGNSTCSISNTDVRQNSSPHQTLLVLTTTSSNHTPKNTVYQTLINPYLTATTDYENDNMITNPYSSIDVCSNDKEATDEPINIQGPCGNCTYEMKSDANTVSSLLVVNDEQLIVEEKFGSGTFGMLYRGYVFLRHPEDTLKSVLIKSLSNNANDEAKKCYEKEYEILSQIQHANITSLLCYTTKNNYLVMEHSDLGDLYTFLSITSKEKKNLSTNIRLLFTNQIADAMCYLESKNIIHRDLSARNCLIYPEYELKLTNSAMASPQFSTHYYQINNKLYPLRWIAPESIAKTRFTSQSDVWGFGICLWEIMTDCSCLPYATLSDEEVLYCLLAMSKTPAVKKRLQLSRPECLSRELLDLMLECWRPYQDRPTFRDIHKFLNNRTDGMML
ncbi:unnamed protein product [Didymodactylos carnosus]|uniref:Uncharacterized protein n=1 Tax=Didymodactylos carnosus TaxID=1234261 RepID=A0A814B574_9BILA|nr:unnamed protein product [Didymodactylos carnosus]CAF1006579.1 unnamed protein product [Didymodactylos carnosus]CAF3702396.1 unnamed protein product [Didymodactylos carnosus]CAF3775639.1 unnamed protein product [Didymodactylos carnosus]